MNQGAKGSSGGLNLDLTEIDDVQEAANAIELFYKNDSVVKSQLSYSWERNQLFLDGRQWIVYEGNRETGGKWNTLQVSKDNEYIPRPVTNYIFDAYQTLKGYLLKQKPRITVRPNSSSHKDKSAAKIATLVSETNYERLKEDQNYEYAASCLVLYATVFKKSYWDNSFLNQVKIPVMTTIPTFDPMTGAPTGEQEVQAVDENGEPMVEVLPLGDVNTDVVEPYRIALDPLANDLHKARWIMEYAIQPLDWIKKVYGKTENGFTGRVDEIKTETALNSSMRRFFQLKTSSGVKGGTITADSGLGSENYIENTAVVKEYYEKPSEKHPKGRLIVVANGIPLYAGDSPCEGPDMGDWHPYSECRWEPVPGRFWGKGPLDDGVETQKIINSIDATVILTRKTMAVPQKLIPKGQGIEPGEWTGRPGHEQFYRPDGSGAKPETIPGQGVHESVFAERERRLEDFKQITGAIDILKGDRPPGVTAASALSMLYEVGTGKLFPILNRWKQFIESDQKKQLRLIAHKYKEVRPDFIRMLKMRNTELSEDDINNFIGEDLYDNCNVMIEAGSNIPKLQAAEQAMLLEVANTGALALDVPENRTEFLTRLGISGFDNDIGPDKKRAEWENGLLDNIQHTPDQRPMVFVCDKHPIHIDCHERRMKEPSFMALPIEVQQAYIQHVEEHKDMQMQQEQMEAMNAMMGMGPPPQAEPGPNQPQGNLHESGNGLGAKMKEALFSDALVPGQSKATK